MAHNQLMVAKQNCFSTLKQDTKYWELKKGTLTWARARRASFCACKNWKHRSKILNYGRLPDDILRYILSMTPIYGYERKALLTRRLYRNFLSKRAKVAHVSTPHIPLQQRPYTKNTYKNYCAFNRISTVKREEKQEKLRSYYEKRNHRKKKSRHPEKRKKRRKARKLSIELHYSRQGKCVYC